MNKHPDRDKCLRYLNEYGTPSHVIGHCKAVAAVAYALGRALNEVGGTRAARFRDIRITTFRRGAGRFYYEQDHKRDRHGLGWRPFDLELVLSSGLLHDMARVKSRHWDVCADWCNKMEFYEEAQIIRAHMMYQYTNDASHLTEADLVSLGDRLTLEDHYAGLDKRMDYIIRKTEKKGDPDAGTAILRKKKETKKLLDEIEQRIGFTIDELMKDLDYDNIEKSE